MDMDADRMIRRYTAVFRKALAGAKCGDADAVPAAYRKRLADMYASGVFRRYSVYPTINTAHVFAVIAMCLELRRLGLTDQQVIDAVNTGFSARRRIFKGLLWCIDRLPNAYRIVEKWNLSDHAKRVGDGSLAYDAFDVSDGRIAYRISRCAYVEMFEAYGIRSLCKIFCMTDTSAYEHLQRHVAFIRHSDLSDGCCCHDVIMDRRKMTDSVDGKDR